MASKLVCSSRLTVRKCEQLQNDILKGHKVNVHQKEKKICKGNIVKQNVKSEGNKLLNKK